MKIEIITDKNCSYCELPFGQMIYGKNPEEISCALNALSGYFAKFETNIDHNTNEIH